MEKNETFFFDTYAFFELIQGNQNYSKYFGSKIVTSKLNLFELCYGLMRDVGENDAKSSVKRYFSLVQDFGLNILIQSAKFKLLNKKENLSLVDCIGYIIAKSMGIRFLTGDEKFRNIPNVEFVK